MNKNYKFLSITLLMLFSIFMGIDSFAQKPETIAGKVRIKISPIVVAKVEQMAQTYSKEGIALSGVPKVDALNIEYNATGMTRVFPYSGKFEEKHQKHGLHLWYELKIDESFDPSKVAITYAQLSEVSFAEPVLAKEQYLAQPIEAPVATFANTSDFDDPGLSLQWHYENDGSLENYIQEADINLFEAWGKTTGSSDVIVAIVDGGLDYDHEDLSDNIWINEIELNGLEGIDDDGNGYPDDIYGYNFAKGNGVIEPHYHGTHVGGTVAAVNNNGKGVSGIAGGDGTPGSGVRLMSSQIFTEDGANGGYANALVYSADMGAVIAQNSWGWRSPDYFEQSVLDAIDYFIEEAGQYSGSPISGGVVIFASGNNGDQAEYWPGAYDRVISVSATGPNNTKASYSNFGSWVDLSAPGGDFNYGTEAGVYSTLPANKYGYLNGTSMACPHVSGIAALVVSQFKNTGMTAEDVKTQLVTAVHNIDPYNPGYEGLLGNGYIDAALALIPNNSDNPPAAITDLTIFGTGTDFADLAWSMPTDPDNEHAAGFEIYWSNTEITAENYQYAASTKIYDLFTPAGSEISFHIDELDATTQYYFAIIAFDRWENKSELSNVISGTTNQGPAIRVESDINIAIDVTSETVATDSAWLYNDEEGVLYWEVVPRHVDNTIDQYNISGIRYPNIDPFNIAIPNFGQSPLEIADGTIEAPHPSDWESSKMNYTPYATVIIGDNDTSVSNSAAIRFQVEDPEGFNLTHFRVHMRHDTSTGPVIIEVYKGEYIEDAKLIFAQEYLSENGYTYDYQQVIQMNEQLFFENGAYFWMVVHVPNGNLYPLGVGPEQSDLESENCKMSNNLGQNWKPLSEVIDDDTYTWAIWAESNMAPIDDYISVSPVEGTVQALDSMKLDISIDGEFVIDGSYTERLVFLSNDNDDKVYTETIAVDVDGHDPILTSAKTINFGSIFAGQTKTLDIQILNEGYVGYKLYGSYVTSSNEDVFYTESTVSGHIPARGEGWVRITFTPDSAATYNEVITINNSTYSYTFNVFGIASTPAILEVIPESDTVPGDLTIGDAIPDTNFTITNNGNYPLYFKVPTFEPDFEIEGLEKPINVFGYSYEVLDLGGTAANLTAEGYVEFYENNIWDELKGGAYAKQVELGFSFPFRDKVYNKVWIHEEGALVFGNEDANFTLDFATGSSINPNYLKDRDMVCAVMRQAEFSSGSGGLYYRQEEGLFRVYYRYVSYGDKTLEFEIVLKANGDVDIFFDSQGGTAVSDNFLIGLVDEANQDVVFAHNSDYSLNIGANNQYDNYAFHFMHPGTNLIASVVPASGILMPGDSVDIEITFNTEKAVQDSVYQHLPIVSNDGYKSIKTYTTVANFTAGGIDSLVMADTLNFGDVYRTAIDSMALNLANYGSAIATVNGVTVEQGHFSYTRAIPFDIGIKQSAYLYFTINTATAEQLIDSVEITTTSGDVFKVVLIGNIVENAVIGLDPASITYTMDARTTKDTVITINNTGNGELEYAIIPATWYYPIEPDVAPLASAIKDFEYIYLENSMSNFMDISTNENATRWDNWYDVVDNEYFQTVVLPEPVEFYGEFYDTMYVHLLGYVSFSRPGKGMLARPIDLPDDTDGINNFIAPFSGLLLHYDIDERRDNGVYYLNENGKLIVQWHRFKDIFSMSYQPFSFELILDLETGRIDFEYSNFLGSRASGLIGLENESGTEGTLALLDFPPSDGSDFSYTFFPVEKKIVAPNSSEEITLRIDASTLYDGTYNGNVQFVNNTVGVEQTTFLPINLTVNGEGSLYAEDLHLGDVFYEEGMILEQQFEMTNIGTAAMILDTAIFNKSDSIVVEHFYLSTNPRIPSVYTPVNEFIGDGAYVNGWFGPQLVEDGTTLSPNNSWTFFVTYVPGGPGSMNAEVYVRDAADDTVLTWSTTVNFVLPPAAEVNVEEITLNADDDTFTKDSIVYISNKLGLNELSWDVSLKYNRGTAETTAAPSSEVTAFTASLDELKAVSNTNINTNNSVVELFASYNRTLEYDTTTSPYQWLGFGTFVPFKSGTHFISPTEGFSLSHVETWFRPEGALNGNIIVEIRAGGDNIANATVVATGNLEYSLDGADNVGQFYTIALNEEVYIFPGENFWVVITYPLGISNPQGTHFVELLDREGGKYFYEYDGEWFDLGLDNSFNMSGYMVKAHETQLNVKNWVVVNNNSGNATAGDSSAITLSFNSMYAPEFDNNATLNISTNDPYNPEFVVDINLLMNKPPVISKVGELAPSVTEGETITVSYTATDAEKDDLTLSIAESFDFIEFTISGNDVIAVVTPTHEDQGIHQFTITAVDEHGAESSESFEIEVLNVNRAPVAAIIEEQNLTVLEPVYSVALTDVISDPDGEVLSYTFSADDETVVDVSASDVSNMLYVYQLSLGTTTVTVTGTDAEGLSDTATIVVNVTNPSSLINIDADQWRVYPNPTKGDVFVQIGNELGSGNMNIKVINVLGEVIYFLDNPQIANEVKIPLNEFKAGIYIIEMNSEKGQSIKRVIKK